MSAALCVRFRLPFAGLFAAAIGGILLGNFVAIPSGVFLIFWIGSSAGAWFERTHFLIWMAVVAAFATLAVWGGRESPAAGLARLLDASWQPVEAEFAVNGEPEAFGEAWRFPARLHGIVIDDRPISTGAQMIVDWNGPPPSLGDRFRVIGAARNVPPARNPGQFDVASWLATNEIRSELSVARAADAEFLGAHPHVLADLARKARDWIERTLATGIAGTPEESVIRAMTIGDTAGAPETITEAFRQTGTYHLFSVSGLHVGMIAVLLWGLLSTVGISRKRAVLILIPALFFYALITGFKPPSVRAATMVSVVAAGLLFDRRPMPLNSLGAAGFFILLVQPNELFNPGFQLSFTIVTVILLIAVPLQRSIDRRLAPDPFLPVRLLTPLQRSTLGAGRWIGGLLAVSTAAWIGSLPLTLIYFHMVSLIGIPANIFAVPLSFLVLALALLSLVTGLISLGLSELLNNTNFLVTHVLLGGVTGFAALPGSHFAVGLPLPRGTIAEVTILDCGGGGATVIRTPRSTWLIDGGSRSNARSIVIPFLRSQGINRLDGIVLTHGDSRHVGGVPNLLASPGARQVFDSGLRDRSRTRTALLRQLEDSGRPAEVVVAGDRLEIAPDVTLTVLHPTAADGLVYADDKCIVVRLDVGSTRILFTSDAGHSTEAGLVANHGSDLRCDILVKGQHVAGFSGDRGFLAAAQPQSVVATAADFPPAEKITDRFVANVASIGAQLFRQDETGAVTITIRADGSDVRRFLEGGSEQSARTNP